MKKKNHHFINMLIFFFWAFIYFTSGKQDNALKNDFFFNKPRENKRSRHLVHGDVITKQQDLITFLLFFFFFFIWLLFEMALGIFYGSPLILILNQKKGIQLQFIYSQKADDQHCDRELKLCNYLLSFIFLVVPRQMQDML